MILIMISTELTRPAPLVSSLLKVDLSIRRRRTQNARTALGNRPVTPRKMSSSE